MQKDLLKLLDLSKEDILNILNTADQLKYNQKHGIVHDYLHGKTLAMIFEKNSTRTRVSFETGMFQLGGHALFLSGKESQIGRGEPVEDTARVLDRYCDGIMIRTFAQEEVEELARYTTIAIIFIVFSKVSNCDLNRFNFHWLFSFANIRHMNTICA